MTMRNEKGLWVKGHSGNPNGKGMLRPEIRLLVSEKSSQFMRQLMFWLDSPPAYIAKCEGATWEINSMDRMICSAIIQAMNGDWKCLQSIFDRVWGKPKESIQLTGTETKEVLASYTEEQFIEHGERVIKRLKKNLQIRGTPDE